MIYLSFCPFIDKFHSFKNYVFCSYLADSNHTATALDYMIENSISHVDKNVTALLTETIPDLLLKQYKPYKVMKKKRDAIEIFIKINI